MGYKALLFSVIFAMSIGLQGCASLEESILMESAQPPCATEIFGLSSVRPVWIDAQSVQNARQLGGYPAENNRMVRSNAILRAGELASLTIEDEELLIQEYKLAHIIDLRDEIEVLDSPDTILEGVQYHHLIVWPRDVRTRIIQESTTAVGFDFALYIENYYTAFALEPAAIKAYREMFKVLLENDSGSVLIHCVHGKDRTGIAAALVLCALGVEWDVIELEYLLSNDAYAGSVDISSLRYYKLVVEKNYGSMGKYLEVEMNLDEGNIKALKEKYTVSR